MLEALLRPIDRLIDGITMYRLVLYYLIGLLLAAVGLNLMGSLQISAVAIIGSSLILAASCWIVNKALAFFFDAPINSESSLITALILALIITPSLTRLNIVFMLAAAGLAMSSKYILAIHRKHLFNPAAVAIALTALGADQAASWWVGSAVMLPFVLIGGALLVRKLRRVGMIVIFFAVTTIATGILAAASNQSIATSLQNMALSSAVWFLGFIMLTEPLTSPTTYNRQLWYGALVGVLLPPQVHILNFYSSPEVALLAGNLFAYLVSQKTRLFPVLREKAAVAANTFDFVFEPQGKLAYLPGQYVELTMPHTHTDARGDRRYFTLASSPTEPDLRFGIKFYEPGSSFKRALVTAGPQTKFSAAQVAGDFVLPRDRSQKLAFIAGGIGITPFRSMIKYLLDTDDHRSVTLLYSARTRADVAYAPLLEEARRKLGVNASYILTDEPVRRPVPNVYTGQSLTSDLIREIVPDYQERVFYISGTHPMVVAVKDSLRALGIPMRQIKTDFFPGYA